MLFGRRYCSLIDRVPASLQTRARCLASPCLCSHRPFPSLLLVPYSSHVSNVPKSRKPSVVKRDQAPPRRLLGHVHQSPGNLHIDELSEGLSSPGPWVLLLSVLATALYKYCQLGLAALAPRLPMSSGSKLTSRRRACVCSACGELPIRRLASTPTLPLTATRQRLRAELGLRIDEERREVGATCVVHSVGDNRRRNEKSRVTSE